jgi:hypothetical protein
MGAAVAAAVLAHFVGILRDDIQVVGTKRSRPISKSSFAVISAAFLWPSESLCQSRNTHVATILLCLCVAISPLHNGYIIGFVWSNRTGFHCSYCSLAREFLRFMSSCISYPHSTRLVSTPLTLLTLTLADGLKVSSSMKDPFHRFRSSPTRVPFHKRKTFLSTNQRKIIHIGLMLASNSNVIAREQTNTKS